MLDLLVVENIIGKEVKYMVQGNVINLQIPDNVSKAPERVQSTRDSKIITSFFAP